ncbi:MAG TPA: hypothetical protein VG757_08495 [Devosia sp.]|nr:hypothetical protein [Devosia sp.]
MRMLGAALAVLMLSAAPAFAGPSGDVLRDSLYAGDLQKGLATLTPLAESDPEARFGVGMLDLAIGVERFAQTLYRHGLTPPNAGPMTPNVTLPVPPNPNPEPWNYEGVRQMFEALVADFDTARGAFETAAAEGDYVIVIDPLQIRFDLNADGKVDPAESIEGMVGLMTGSRFGGPDNQTNETLKHEIGFDRADAYWLAGYSDVIVAQADFLLAHDFSDFVNVLFHRFFPKAGFPMQEYSKGGQLMLDPETDAGISDAVAAIHTISWPVTDATRLAGVRERMKAVIGYSRQNWDAILAETDDNHELLPSPKQTPPVPEAKIDDAKVAAWRATLDQADRILDGELLVPHWRFAQGFDLKAYFETAKRTDLVMILTGYGAVPFLKDGPIASPQDFREAQQAFGSNWLGYAFWFN